jgi:hypothetical protein
MNKLAVSVTLLPDNILWLKARVKAGGRRSLSEALDEIITQARAGAGRTAAEVRSVVGNARIPRSEASLSRADAEVRALFRASAGRESRSRPRTRRKRV